MTSSFNDFLYFGMRFLLSLLIIALYNISMFPQSQNLALDNVVTIDMRHGLSESRVRAIQPLTDGRIAVVTAGYLNIFDGTSTKIMAWG